MHTSFLKNMSSVRLKNKFLVAKGLLESDFFYQQNMILQKFNFWFFIYPFDDNPGYILQTCLPWAWNTFWKIGTG